MSSMALSTFNYAFSPLSLSPQVPYYMESFDSTLPEVINFIGVSVLVLGFTNFIWIPLSRGFGRRPVAIVTILITTASCIWRAKATTYNSFLGSAILCGIGSSPGETLGPVIITDIAFLHERGFWMGVYQWAFWSGLMVCSLSFFDLVCRRADSKRIGGTHRSRSHGAGIRLAQLLVAFDRHLCFHQPVDTVLPARDEMGSSCCRRSAPSGRTS